MIRNVWAVCVSDYSLAGAKGRHDFAETRTIQAVPSLHLVDVFQIDITSKSKHEISKPTITSNPLKRPMLTDSTCQIEKPQALTGTPPGAMNFQGKNKSKYPRTQPGPDFTIGNPWDFGVLRFLLKRTLRNLFKDPNRFFQSSFQYLAWQMALQVSISGSRPRHHEAHSPGANCQQKWT